MPTNKDIATLLFIEIQVIVADSEGALLTSTNRLETVTSKYGLKITTSKMKQWLLRFKASYKQSAQWSYRSKHGMVYGGTQVSS